jgi:AcrR family transcriptional regulator
MVETPWGKMDELRAQRLRPGPGTDRQVVVRNQRERIFAAMVASTATKGYPATTVADLIALAGVSRATFYEHFADKADCFRATIDALLGRGLALIEASLSGAGSPGERGENALRAFLELTASQPAAARVSLVDAYSAGAAGLEPINDAFEQACELAHEALRTLPNRSHTPEQLSRAVIGGLHRVIYIHLYRDEAESLLHRSDDLWRWASGYEPPEGLPTDKRRRRAASMPTVHPGRDLHERILRGFARAVAARGFPNLTIPHVSAETGISNATFYQHFENKDDALLAALDLSEAQLLAAALPAARRAAQWPEAVHRALEGLCAFLASEPAFARLRAVEVYAAGPEALAHRDRALETILAELVPDEVRTGPGEIALAASSGAVYALLYEKVRKGELDALQPLAPLLSYLLLAPLLGGNAAAATAAGPSSPAARLS